MAIGPVQRIDRIRAALAPLRPLALEIEDQSHLHVGHAGARDGRGHFRVVIVAAGFANLPLIERHRIVYRALGTLLETDIHAIAIEALAPTDRKSPP